MVPPRESHTSVAGGSRGTHGTGSPWRGVVKGGDIHTPPQSEAPGCWRVLEKTKKRQKRVIWGGVGCWRRGLQAGDTPGSPPRSLVGAGETHSRHP